MVHATRGIVLRTVKYGETSIVATIFTEKFGVQAYLINGVRTTGKAGAKASLYQPATLLNLEVYHNELKNMQRIREAGRSLVGANIFSDVIKNSVAVFMIELLHRSLKQPEENAPLFAFVSHSLEQLEESHPAVTANFPLFFSLNLPHFFGFAFSRYYQQNDFLDLREGGFTRQQPDHQYFLGSIAAQQTAELLKVMHPDELNQVPLNSDARNTLLDAYVLYFRLHIADFGEMRTLPILRQIL